MVGSSSSSSEGKKSDDGLLFLRVLDGDLGWEVSCKLGLFKVEIVVVHENTMPFDKLDICYAWSWIRDKCSL